MGFKRARADKQREWFIITGDNEKASIDIVEGIVDELVETSLNEQMLEVQKRGTSLNEQMLEVQKRKSLRIPPVQVKIQQEAEEKARREAEEKARLDATDDFIRRAEQHIPDTNTYTTHWNECTQVIYAETAISIRSKQ